MARIIALALDLDVDFFDRPEMLGGPIATLRLLHYEGGQKNRSCLPVKWYLPARNITNSVV